MLCLKKKKKLIYDSFIIKLYCRDIYKEASRKLPFPSLLIPTTKTSDHLFYFLLFYLTKSHLSLYFHSLFSSFYFLFFDLFLCHSSQAPISLFSNGSSKLFMSKESSKLSMAVVTAASI